MAVALTTDVVVVGAGMAGLYAAMRLAASGASVVILERLGRTGGRLDTDIVTIDGVQVKNEEGGMRFMNSHTTLMALIDLMNLQGQIVPFSMGDSNNRYYIRGKAFSFGDAAANNNALWSTLYTLAPGERNLSPGQITSNVLNTLLAQNNMSAPQTPEDWQSFRLNAVWRGSPLNQWGFWSFLTDYGLSQECIKMLDDTGGFKAPFDKQGNAGAAFQLMGDFVKPQFNTLLPGYSALPDALVNVLTSNGVDIRLQNHVRTFTGGSGGFQVTAEQADGTNGTFQCKLLILALPQKALHALSYRCPSIDTKAFRHLLGSVIDMPLTKVNAYYESRWWYTSLNLSAGGSFADLPMAQLYTYIPMIPSDTTGPATLTMYCDDWSGSYWQSLQSMGGPYVGSIPQPVHTVPASTAVVQALQAQLQLMLPGVQNMPMPVVTTYKHWGLPQFGDGDHMWARGANDLRIMPQLQNPSAGLFTCGEAYSDNQAWVDGALRSVDQMLATAAGLKPLPDALTDLKSQFCKRAS
jgi:monoamine oxidase